MNKRYEVLESLPTYGPMYVSIPEDNYNLYSEGLPVRFFKSDGTDWVANFQNGYTDLIATFDLKEFTLIIAGGICYIMDPDHEDPISTFGFSYNYASQLTDGRIVLVNDIEITIVEKDGSFWFSERIALDGITITNIENNIITGQYSEYTGGGPNTKWFDFSFNIDTKEGIGFSKLFALSPKLVKPWWKIWQQ